MRLSVYPSVPYPYRLLTPKPKGVEKPKLVWIFPKVGVTGVPIFSSNRSEVMVMVMVPQLLIWLEFCFMYACVRFMYALYYYWLTDLLTYLLTYLDGRLHNMSLLVCKCDDVCEGLLSEFSATLVHGDQRIHDISVLHLLQHSSGWDHRVIGDPVFMTSLRSVHADARQRSLASKSNIVNYMMNQTLQYQPGKPRRVAGE